MTSHELAEVFGDEVPVEYKSIFGHCEESLQNNCNGLAIVAMHQKADHLADIAGPPPSSFHEEVRETDCLVWSYGQLHTAAMRLAVGLMARGVQPGMCIVTLMQNGVEHPLTLWISAILRLKMCSFDPGAVEEPRRDELFQLIERLRSDVIVVQDAVGAQAVDQVLEGLDSEISAPKVKIVLNSSTTTRPMAHWTPISAIAVDGQRKPVDEEALLKDARRDDPSRDALVLFTSGTSTGHPKGVPRDAGAISHSMSHQKLGRGLDTLSRILAYATNFRILAPTLFLAAWKAGSACIIPNSGQFIPEIILQAIEKYRITFISTLPAMVCTLIANPAFEEADVSSVRDLSVGGDMLTRDFVLEASRAFPAAKICNIYGMTEGVGAVSWPFSDLSHEDIPFLGDICPAGRVNTNAGLRIRGSSDGVVVKRGESGEVCVSCKAYTKGYLDGDHEDSFFTDDKGRRWFKTGDFGMIDSAGILYVHGRVKDIIKRAGVPITPAALEGCIKTFVESETCVVAWPHETLGQEPLAVIKDLNGKTKQEVKGEVKRMFGPDYALGPVLALEELRVDAFPLNATGKVDKLRLMSLLENYFDSLESCT